jgi:hypothetical protein
VSSEPAAPLRVQPMSERGVSFDLVSVFPIGNDSFLLTYEVEGYGKKGSASFSVR